MIFSKLPNKAVTTPEVAVLMQGMRSEKAFAVTKTGDIKMSGKFLARASALSLAFVLAACGGDDSSSSLSGVSDQTGNGSGTPGSGNGDSSSGGTDDGITVGSLRLSASPVQLGTGDTAESTIIAFAKDADNILLTGVPVAFSVDNDAALAAKVVETDENGRAVNTLTSPSNAQNRVATVTAKIGDQEATIAITINGTNLSLEGPASVSAGDTPQFTATLENSQNTGVALEQIAISNSNPQNQLTWETNTTSDNGTVTFNYIANQAGTDTITVSAFSGENTITSTKEVTVADNTFSFTGPAGDEIDIDTLTTVTLTWEENGTPISGQPVQFFSSRGSIIGASQVSTDGAGNASVTVESQTAGPAIIQAKATDPSTSLEISTDKRFEFVATTPSALNIQADRTQLQANESSRLTAVVRDNAGNLVKNQTVSFKILSDVSSGNLFPPAVTTNSLGRASTTFTAGASPSGRDQVEIGAEVGALNETFELTVSGGASRLTIGTGNEITEPDSDHYSKPWSVFVSDVNGQPVENAEVELAVIPVSFGKGEFIQVDTDGDGELDTWSPDRLITCPSEDINRNGILDATEVDVNGNGKLDPTNEAVVTTADNQTDQDGAVHFDIKYPQSSCAWTEVLIEARTRVSGTEYKESATVTLSCSSEDLLNLEVTPPSFNGGSKYGKTADCSTDE
ncbi:Ig-like domain-containing protein [Marinobacter alkaliphilus]|uniref:Ig-like domain-containing protein n=1 Tax=Marinobacter alkaliphilus TaxID=254719 RepID=A0ABZ3E4J7_9GAMM